MIESSHQPKYFPTYCSFQGLGTCPKTKGRFVVDPTAWPFHRRKPSNILFPSVQWQILFPFQPGVVVHHESPRCVWLLTLRCVFQVVAKTLQKPSLISISIQQSTMTHILAREWNCEEDPLRNPVREKGFPEDTNIPIDHENMCQNGVKGCSLRKKTLGPLSEQSWTGATQNNFRLSRTFASLLTRQPNDPAATHEKHCLLQGLIKRRTKSQTFQGTRKFPDVGQGCSRQSIHTCFIPNEIYQSARSSKGFRAHKFHQNEW